MNHDGPRSPRALLWAVTCRPFRPNHAPPPARRTTSTMIEITVRLRGAGVNGNRGTTSAQRGVRSERTEAIVDCGLRIVALGIRHSCLFNGHWCLVIGHSACRLRTELTVERPSMQSRGVSRPTCLRHPACGLHPAADHPQAARPALLAPDHGRSLPPL